MRERSIRQMMLYIIGGVLTAMMLFHIAAAYSNSRTIRELNEVVEFQLFYDSYESMLDTLQEAVTDYFNQSEKVTDTGIETLCLEFKEYSAKLTEQFSHPQFVDNMYIAQSYLEAVQTFLERGREGSAAEQFSYYNQTVKLHRIVLDSYETTQAFEREIITGQIHKSSADWREREKILSVLGILVCIIAFWRGKKFVDRISKPIIVLTEETRQIMRKNYEKIQKHPQIKSRCRETTLLWEAFYEMTGTIRQQMEELQEKIIVSQKLHKLEVENMQTKMSLNQTEMCLMQSLISPHFLFNCLSTLTSLAFIEEAHQTEECSIQLAKFLRKFLDHIGKTITIREEVEHIRQYIEIQKLRFSKRISFQVECEPACEEKKIPALVLQPLVENALSHGLKNCRNGGTVEILISKKEEKITLEVRDNGDGIRQEKIRQIETDMGKPFESGEKGIGLRSTAYRLRYSLGEDAVIHIRNRERGTSVVIEIPAV